MGNGRDILLVIGDWIIAFGSIPTFFFLVEYGLFRWLRRRHGRRFVPWWSSGIGIMIFLLALGLLCVEGNVIASLFLGVDYPFREWFRIIGYTISSVSAVVLLAIYAKENRDPEPSAPVQPK